MTNKDLLKEAIAEATTIREAAIANAKEALEESITPHLREMLAQKLQEMDELEETDNNGTDSQVDGEGDDIDHGNIVNEDEETPEEDETEEEAPEEEEETEEDEEFDLENMTKAEFTAEVEKIVAQVSGAPEGEDEMPGEEGLEDMEDDNTINIDAEDEDNADNMEEINIDELLAELDGLDEDYGSEKAVAKSKQDTPFRHQAKVTTKTGRKFDGHGKGWNQQQEELEEDKQELYEAKRKASETGKDLEEALKAVKILRNQLQEVNLLNAKLLYVNKVFKSNNLSEGQKVNVIAAFDKAETVKEVKLVFETVSKNVVVKKPTTVKEHRSFASKATGMTAAPKKEIISEVSEQVLRMQKLAGIIK